MSQMSFKSLIFSSNGEQASDAQGELSVRTIWRATPMREVMEVDSGLGMGETSDIHCNLNSRSLTMHPDGQTLMPRRVDISAWYF